MMLAALNAAAQNLNSTVDVSNEYSNTFSGVNKSDIAMNVPDSLLQFNKDFDYAVFENPFKGSYEFTPYSVQLRPEQGYYGDRCFWLNAGAGWTMHPVLQAVFSPALRDAPGFKMSIYQDGSGYYGGYRNQEGNSLNFTEKAGIDMHASTKNFKFMADAGYEGIYAGPSGRISMMHSGKANVRLASLNGRFFGIEGDLSGRYALLPDRSRELSLDLKAKLEPKFGKSFRVPMDVNLQTIPSSSIFLLSVVPHLRLKLGPVDLLAGVNLGFKAEPQNPSRKSNNGFKFAPDVHAGIDIAKGVVTFYADVDGGCELYSAADILSHNHFIAVPTSAVSDKVIRFNGGLRGHISSNFQYDIRGGYGIYNSAPLDGPAFRNSLTVPSVVEMKFNMAYADALLVWRSERVDIDAGVHFKRTDLDGAFEAFDLPAFSGSLKFIYNYEKRIFAGISCEASTERTGNLLEDGTTRAYLPAYADLGLYAEYKFTREFSLWLKGSNLLNMNIYRIPFYCEKGISATVGITLNL